MPAENDHDSSHAAVSGVGGPEDTHLREQIDAVLRVGRAALPIVVADHDGSAGFAAGLNDRQRFHRIWAAALFCRTLDGYEAVARLHDARLDVEARAYTRIAFEHLVSFAWVAERRDDIERPLRIVHHDIGLNQVRRRELADHFEFVDDVEHPFMELMRAVVAHDRAPQPLPSTRELCHELDRTLAPRIRTLRPGSINSFTGWYAYVYRGASALLHPSTAGVTRLIDAVPGGLRVAPSRTTPDDILPVVADHVAAALAIAAETAPWLVDP